jgi:hypothetical protein
MRGTKARRSQGHRTGKPPIPRGVPAPHGRNRVSGGAGGVSPMQNSPQRRSGSSDAADEGAGRRGKRRLRSSGLRHLVRQGDEDAGSLLVRDRPQFAGERPTGTERRVWIAAAAEVSAPAPRARRSPFRGSLRPGRRGAPSGAPGRRKARRWALRLEALGLVVLRAWDRVAASSERSPSGSRRQTTPDGRSGQETPRVAAVLETATWQGSKPSREWKTPRTERAG